MKKQKIKTHTRKMLRSFKNGSYDEQTKLIEPLLKEYKICTVTSLITHRAPHRLDLIEKIADRYNDGEMNGVVLHIVARDLRNVNEKLIEKLLRKSTILKSYEYIGSKLYDLIRLYGHYPQIVEYVVSKTTRGFDQENFIFAVEAMPGATKVHDIIFSRITDFEGFVEYAIDEIPYSIENVRKIAEKDEKGFLEYSWFFFYKEINNRECYICMEDINDKDEIHRMVCGHRIHKECNMQSFKCRFH